VVTRISRQLRDTDLVARLKVAYGYRCQFCKTSIPMGRGRGWYCEAHHIRPLGIPHHGADTSDNILIVCPNHHKMLDYGAMIIDPSKLALLLHDIADSNVRYHNEELQTVA
jgi:predicted restriction endonuclease